MPFFLVRVAVSLLRKLMLPLSLFVALGPNPEPSAGDLEAQAGTVNLPGALQQMVGTWKLQEKLNVDKFMDGLGIKGPLQK